MAEQEQQEQGGTCPKCAALVADMRKHADWHGQADNAGRRAVQEWERRTVGRL